VIVTRIDHRYDRQRVIAARASNEQVADRIDPD